VLATLVLVLSACSAAPAAQAANQAANGAANNRSSAAVESSATGATATPQVATVTAKQDAQRNSAAADQPPANTDELIALKLALGTLKLQGTDQAITADQSASLVSLWTEYQTLSASLNPQQGAPGQDGSGQGQPPAQGQDPSAQVTPDPTQAAAAQAAQDQLNAILDKIKAAMTEDQLKAIDAMQITQDTAQTIMTELGISVDQPGGKGGAMPGGGQPPAGDAGQGATPQGTPPAAPDGSTGGTPPQGGPGMGGGRMGSRVSSAVLEALLSALQAIQ
jgi:hypothetical protein